VKKYCQKNRCKIYGPGSDKKDNLRDAFSGAEEYHNNAIQKLDRLHYQRRKLIGEIYRMRLMTVTTIAELRDSIKIMYSSAGFIQRALNSSRPYICPFHTLLKHVPQNSTVLDIGCGSGLFLNLLAYRNIVNTATGIDAAKQPIITARAALKVIEPKADIIFEHRKVEEGLPDMKFSVVSMIDVIHHIDPNYQRSALESAVSRVSDNGIFLFKDIGSRPLWRAWANRFHDLLLARQWIYYVKETDVQDWIEKAGFQLVHQETINMWWYGHNLMIFQNKATSKSGHNNA